MVKDRFKPVPTTLVVDNKKYPVQRIVVKFSNEDIERLKKIGRFYLPENLVKRGAYCLEIGEVMAVSDGEKQIKPKDKVITSYSLISIDRSNDGKDLRDNEWLYTDNDGNEFAAPLIDRRAIFQKVFGIIRGKKIEPIDGTVFCEPPIHENEAISSIIFTGHLKKSLSDTKSYKAIVKYISANDSKATGIKKGDTIIAKKNSDIAINIKDQELIRIPLDYIVAKIEK